MHTLQDLRAGKLAGIHRLDLKEGLTEFPPEILDLADSLEVLNLSGNKLTTLPAGLGRLRKLRILFCSDNNFTTVPEVLGDCPQLSMVGFKANQLRTLPAAALPAALRWLILTDNQLATLPTELGHCAHLQKLMLAGNQLRQLPAALAQCTRLELLRLAANQLPELPAWLLELPRLAWLAYAGNPCSASQEELAAVRYPVGSIGWPELVMQQQLGEGASGVIYRAEWRHPAGPPTEVAVKLFKGAVTSDGLPHSEMLACMAAGAHPNLVGVAGKLIRHPAGTEGLVLDLIAPAFKNLAGPPSLDSCTRDVYAPDTAFSLAAAGRLAHGIASATAQLHRRGILHGDLYAHNILATPGGAGLLGDFGAASFFDPAAPGASALQCLEARAFGCLLEELLLHCPTDAVPGRQVMTHLQQQCVQPGVMARPSFAEMAQELSGFQ